MKQIYFPFMLFHLLKAIKMYNTTASIGQYSWTYF